MLASIRPGQVVSFIYNRGTNPGSRRLIAVTENSPSFIKGTDLNASDSNRYRNFSVSEISLPSLNVVADLHEEVVRMSDILTKPTKLAAANALHIYNILHPNRKGVRYNVENDAIVVLRDDLPRVEFTVTEKQTQIDFVNENGSKLGLKFDHTADAKPFSMTCRLDNLTLVQFANELVSHIKGAISPKTTVDGWQDHVQRQVAKGNPLYANLEASH
jgi:hypothetical protein